MSFDDMLFYALALIGGLALFLYGMHVMGDGLSKLSGGRLEQILERLTSNPIKAVLLGAGVTAVIQSSSATTVTVVGFVNSGIMKLGQAIDIIMGANIGTTVTSWLLSLTGIESDNFVVQLLKPSSFSPVLAIVGVILIMSARTERRKDVGGILIGFAVLMFGMDQMSGAVKPLADVPEFTNILLMFSNPILGMLAGAILTAVIQSSSASVGILQALCATGSLHYSAALPIIMGQNIGTCVTALLSAVGTNKNAKRAALVHLYFNVIGTIVFMSVFYLINAFVHFDFLQEAASPAGIAVIHTCFNVLATAVLLPFAKGLEKLAMLTIREEEGEKRSEFAKLDDRFLDSPALALEQCKNSADEMAALVLENITTALEGWTDFQKKSFDRVEKTEEKIDRYEEELTAYLQKIINHGLPERDSDELNMLLYCIRDFERISDHACNIMELVKKDSRKKAEWPKKTREEMMVYARQVKKIVDATVSSFISEDMTAAGKIENMEAKIDKIDKRVKKQNMKRMRKEKCQPEVGIFVSELAINFERVADHCENIAISLMGNGEEEL